MRILDRSVYVGPSLYASFPVTRLELDLGALEAWPTGRLGAKFVDDLAAALPGLAQHGCSYREPGGFFRRMREDQGTWLGHVFEHVAIELQNIAAFDSTFFQAPGRMNVFNEHPFKVLFDYGHNAHSVGMMADLASRLDVTGRRIVVLAGPGDRRDEDLTPIAKAVAGRFDHYICRRDDNPRKRAPDEVPRIQARPQPRLPRDSHDRLWKRRLRIDMRPRRRVSNSTWMA